MGVQLNIKDAETVRLARELSDATGKSITHTIKAALEAAVAQREKAIAERVAAIHAAAAEFRRGMTEEQRSWTSKEVMDSIYVDGLPE